MKRITMVLLIVTSIFLISACAMFAEKDALSVDEFTNLMRNNNFDVEDITSEFAHMNVIESYIVTHKDGLIVEFIVFGAEHQALSSFNQNRQDFINARGSGSSHSEVNAANHNRYRQTSAGMFSFVGRIDNTVVFINTPEENRSMATEIIDLLGY